MGPGMMQPQAIWFARRGWVVAIVTRRGYGSSGGKMDKTHYGCDESAFATIADQNAHDLEAAYDTVKNLPQVGGWHSMFFSGSCANKGLVPEFHNLGAATHVPTLWLYAKNDSLFGPKYVAQMHEAFTSAGGEAELPVIGKSGNDGHYMFSESVEVWAPLVEDFLAKHGLPWQDLDPEYGGKIIKLPDNYPGDIKNAFAKWQKMGPNKAFALGPNWEWAYSIGRKTLKIAKDEALDRCRNPKCEIIAYEGQ